MAYLRRTPRLAAQRAVLNKVLEYPFGDDFQPPDNAGSSTIFSTEALESHVAGHMKEIALLTLQKLPIDGDEDTNIDSDQPLEDEGTTGPFGIKRASMCSILDDELLDFSDDDQIGEGDFRLNLKGKDDQGLSELYRAVQKQDLGLLVTLAQGGVDLNSKDENGQTPLHHAAERSSIECIRVLIDHGADPDIADNSGFSPLVWALIAGHEDATQQLLFEGPRVKKTDMDYALSWAARLGTVTIAKMITECPGSVSGGHLLEAAASGHIDIVSLLLDKGSSLRHHNSDGWSAIHYAAQEGHLDIVELLIARGTSPHAVNRRYGTSPLHCAASGGHFSIVRLIFQMRKVSGLKATERGWTTLHHAAYMGYSDVVWAPLEYDLDAASQPDMDGWTALHLAVLRRDPVTVRILFDAVPQMQVYIDDIEGWLYSSRGTISDLAFDKSRCGQALTGLRQAVSLGSVPLVKLLIKLGHDINGTDSGNRIALYEAVRKHILPMIDLLIAHGADPNILPIGRIDKKEYASDHSILRRLTAARYKRPTEDGKIVEVIRQELQLRKQRRLELELPASLSGQSTSPDPWVRRGQPR